MANNYRLGKNDKARYTSMDELRSAFGLKAISKQTSDAKKLAEQREKFTRSCKVCGSENVYIEGTNIVVCSNPKCKSNKQDAYSDSVSCGSFRVLDEKGLEIAQNLFA